ncbi:class I SAM-dependent methyltransferase [Alkalicoccobacillus porphyridii]|uniref:Class I SAM-dependent methyltransferase n=1 Tax=Alkalicoccobacillus porphyridii TaxID=2597270 RepID=A0A553ZW70_9BACI|nr:class I SAM-dependent methyltransferase [Alkalicoccobacillus porphyridii]TSB45719.1 class I SAM-dependent methyltransferase [Alkalicoccobacillus porphyridii]
MDVRLQRKIHNLENIDRVEAKEVFKYLSPSNEDHVLDLGAGTGYISLAIAKHVQSVVAFDFDSEILQYLEEMATHKKIKNIDISVGDFTEMNLVSESFDKSVASISLHEVQPLSTALREIHRVLKENGMFVCIEIEKVDGIQAPRVSSEEMREEMIKAGFTIEEVIFPEMDVAGQPVYIIVGLKSESK